MLKIDFLPESDLQDIEESVEEYRSIWVNFGEKIVTAFNTVLGFDFQESHINALVFSVGGNVSRSHPMALKANCSIEEKKSLLIHELAHRIIYKKRHLENMDDLKDSHLTHFHLDLFLFDVWEAVYGKDFALNAKELEKGYSDKYKTAWEKSEQLTTEERAALLKQIFRQ